MSAKQFVSAGDAKILFTQVGSEFDKRPTTFVGTKATWDVLSVADKAQYTIVVITDDNQ